MPGTAVTISILLNIYTTGYQATPSPRISLRVWLLVLCYRQHFGDDKKKETPLEVIILQAEEGGWQSLVGDGRHSRSQFAARFLVLVR